MGIEFLKKVEWTPFNVFKFLALGLIGLFVLLVALRLILPVTGSVLRNAGGFAVSLQGTDAVTRDAGYYEYDEEAAFSKDGSSAPSFDSATMPSPEFQGSVGEDAEEFETTEYSASIETQNANSVCPQIARLKEFDYVVFENSNEYDTGCSYTFKVKHYKVKEVLAQIQSFDPKSLSEETRTIQRQITSLTSEADILQKRLVSIDDTLQSATAAYDEIALLATKTQNVEDLARIIDSKLSLVERLTQQRISIVTQLERLERGKSEQLDRLDYTYFYVSVYENRFIDGEYIKESWKNAVKDFVHTVNRTAQDLSINLIALLLMLVQYALYFFIVLILIKYLWKAAKGIWRR